MQYEIIEGGRLANQATAVAIYEVPNGNNAAGIAWEAAIADRRLYRGEAGTTQIPRRVDDGPYLATLDAGQFVEYSVTVEFDANATNAQKINVLEARLAETVAEATTILENTLQFYGYEGTV